MGGEPEPSQTLSYGQVVTTVRSTEDTTEGAGTVHVETVEFEEEEEQMIEEWYVMCNKQGHDAVERDKPVTWKQHF